MFEATDGQLYFTAQWFYRAEDTVRLLKIFHVYVFVLVECTNFWLYADDQKTISAY